MKSIQLIKQVNNTELGKGGTHETYILIPQELDVSDLFLEIGKEYTFIDKASRKPYTIRLTSAREKRIVGMGPYYRDNNVMAGDQILLEKRIYKESEPDYFISLNRAEGVVYFQKVKSSFEALTAENVANLLGQTFNTANGKAVIIDYHGEIQKRKDSPIMTKVYNILIDNNNIQGDYQDRDMVGISVNGNEIKIIGAQPWKKYVVEVQE